MGFMTENRKPVGYYIRYLPAVYQLQYDELKIKRPKLTVARYAKSLRDPGEGRVFRVYTEEDARDLVIFGRTSIGDGIVERDRENVVEHFGEPLLRKVFENNSVVFGMRGVPEFDRDRIEEDIYGVPLAPYLSGYWYLLEQTELFRIGKGDFFGNVETDRGKLRLYSL